MLGKQSTAWKNESTHLDQDDSKIARRTNK